MHNRFLFESDFSVIPASAQNGESAGVENHNNAYQDGFAAGYDKGLAVGRQDLHGAISNQLHVIEERYSEFLTAHEQQKAEFEQSIFLAVAGMINQFGTILGPVDLLTNPDFGFRQILSRLDQQGELIICATQDTLDEFQKGLADLEMATPLIFQPQDHIKPGDFELTWKDGGLRFDREKIAARYTAIVEQHLHVPK